MGRATPLGNADGYQNKGVAGKAIRKTMKTKGKQIGSLKRHRNTDREMWGERGYTRGCRRKEGGCGDTISGTLTK
jgi:hypothetical protein